MRTSRIVIALLATALIAAASAQNRKAISPDVANANAIRLLSEIKWNDSLDSATIQAKAEGKLIFYMHMLGKIGGDT